MNVLQWMGLTEWLFVVELVLLATGGIFWLISLSMRRSSTDDPISQFIVVFWKVMLRHRVGVAAAIVALDTDKARQYEDLKVRGDVEGIKDLLSRENDGQFFDDTDVNAIVAQARAERGPAAVDEIAPPQQLVTLNVIVIPFSPQDQLVSVRGETVTINSTGGPDDGSVNKVVIDLISTLLAVRPYQVTLTKGMYKANKELQIAGVDSEMFRAKTARYS